MEEKNDAIKQLKSLVEQKNHELQVKCIKKIIHFHVPKLVFLDSFE